MANKDGYIAIKAFGFPFCLLRDSILENVVEIKNISKEKGSVCLKTLGENIITKIDIVAEKIYDKVIIAIIRNFSQNRRGEILQDMVNKGEVKIVKKKSNLMEANK